MKFLSRSKHLSESPE